MWIIYIIFIYLDGLYKYAVYRVKRCSLSKVLLHYINNKNNINVTKKRKLFIVSTATTKKKTTQNHYKNAVLLMNVFLIINLWSDWLCVNNVTAKWTTSFNLFLECLYLNPFQQPFFSSSRACKTYHKKYSNRSHF